MVPLGQTISIMRDGKYLARNTVKQNGVALGGCLLALTMLANATFGQDVSTDRNPGTLNLQTSTVYQTNPGTSVAVFKVFGEKVSNPLDRQALLKMVSLKDQSVQWATTEENSQGAFTNVAFGNYDVEISAVGYLSKHQEVHNTNSPLQQFEIVLHRDPAAINLDVDDRALPSKARKEMRHGESSLKSRKFPDAEKHLLAAHNAAPSSAEINFLLGYLYFQRQDYDKASEYLSAATKLRPHDSQALTLAGRTWLEKKDYPAAQTVLEQAVASDSESWLPHNLLADAYLHQKKYENARDEAQIALDKGKSEANPARLILGQALINMGHDGEGVQALETFLQQSPSFPTAGQVRSLIAEIHDHSSRVADTDGKSGTKLAGVDPLQALKQPDLSVRSWQPPGIDQVKVAMATGVVCPSEKVVEGAGKHVAELADDLSRFSAIEDMFHQNLDNVGNPIRTETRKYNYVASISEPEPGYLAVDESRADKISLEGYPDKIASTGFATLALVFHPHIRENFEMKCEGLGDWRGQASWLVYFKQRDDKPNRMHGYKMGTMIYPVKLKGRAWITADRFQIVRIESEMVRPMPEIKLLSEHQVVEYGPVRFDKKKTSLWLPKSAEIYFEFRQHRYYRRHSFDHYMLFSVDMDEKRKEPVDKPATPPSTTGQLFDGIVRDERTEIRV
jgi:tetratricopeptide (TPR) repeat protein